MAETYEGTPCRRAGHTTRYVKGKNCVQCTKEQSKAYAIDNPLKVANTKAGWKVRNPEKVRAQRRKDYWRNPEHARAQARETRDYDPEGANARTEAWRNENREHLLEYDRRTYRENIDLERAKARDRAQHSKPNRARLQNLRESRKLGAEGHHTLAQIQAILAWQGACCAYCDTSVNLHLDHILAVARGGSNWPWNLQWLCAHHNISKGTKTDAEYRSLIGLPIVEAVSLATWKLLLFAV